VSGDTLTMTCDEDDLYLFDEARRTLAGTINDAVVPKDEPGQS
jgi:hypothetical protein